MMVVVCRWTFTLKRGSWVELILTKLHAGGKFLTKITSSLVAYTG